MADEGPALSVDLHISCKGLKNKDVGSKSDPIVVVYCRKSEQEDWMEVGRTEWQKDNLNPNFIKPICIRYTFEVPQLLRFAVYDVDDERANLAEADFLGDAEATLATVVSCASGVFTEPLVLKAVPKGKAGYITVLAEEVKESNALLTFFLAGRNLDKKDLFGKSDPYIVLNQKLNGNMVPVYKTETIMNSLDPDWNPFTIKMQKLCGGDIDRPIVFDCYDWDKHSSPDRIGLAETTMRQLMQITQEGPVELPLMNPKKAGKRGYKNSGILVVKVNTSVNKQPSFIDYVRDGWEISMITAIDFTASNGDPKDPSSLHHIDPQHPNQYEQAIHAVGSILSYYDHNGMIPAYGYGAKMPDGSMNHCFALNGDPANPEVPGVPGLLAAYHKAISDIELAGPTCFAQIIQKTAQIIKRDRQNQKPGRHRYYVLLIITDGAIADMAETIDEIVDAANNLPLSIVIVGVGTSPELKNMEALDSDEQALRDRNGVVAMRDIVQFVPFNKYAACPQKLAEETLAEIPRQFITYFYHHPDAMPNSPL